MGAKISIEQCKKYLEKAYSITPRDSRLSRMEELGVCSMDGNMYFFYRDTKPIGDAVIRYYTDADILIDKKYGKKRRYAAG